MKKLLTYCFLLLASLVSTVAAATEPLPFKAEYKVRFLGGFVARAELSLQTAENNRYEMSSYARLKLLGKSLTTVNVVGDFLWQDENIVPQNYEYSQTGLGHTNRSIVYDWQNRSASTVVEESELNLPLDDLILDELSMYIEIQQQAAAGKEDIFVSVIDEDVIKEYHYKLTGEERLKTKLGNFNAVKYSRVRDIDSKRKTELWLAKDWNYLVLELHQSSPISTFKIKLQEGIMNNEVLRSLEAKSE